MIQRTAEQQEATNTCAKYLCVKVHSSPCRNKSVTHEYNITCLTSRSHWSLLNSRGQYVKFA